MKSSKYKHHGGESDDDKIQPFRINEIINNIMSVSLNLCMILIFFVVIGIALISVVNIILLIIYSASDGLNTRSDIILKDTLKYKILAYADFLNGSVSTEPLFMINSGASLISLIILAYAFLLLIGMLCVILYFIYTILVPAMYPSFQIDTSISAQPISSYVSIGVIIGLIFAVILGVFHTLFTNKILAPEIIGVTRNIKEIDSFIKKQLHKPDNKFNQELYDLLIMKNKGIQDFDKLKQKVMNDFNNSNYTTNQQNAKAAQKIKLIILYSFLYDNIPDTNLKALALINYYFFKDPTSSSDKPLEIADENELSDLTFISLMLNSGDSKTIPDEYINYDFYSATSDNSSKQQQKKAVKEDVLMFFTRLNLLLTKFTFTNKMNLFIWYIVIFFILTFILFFIYMVTIAYASKGLFNKSLEGAAQSISSVMQKAIPPLAGIVETISDAKHQDAQPVATALVTSDSKQTDTAPKPMEANNTYTMPKPYQ